MSSLTTVARRISGFLLRSADRPTADSRDFLLDLLPNNSIGVEIGVHRGDFSAQILRRVRPQKLYLVDPWRHESDGIYKEAWYGGLVQGGQAAMDERYRQVLARFKTQIDSGTIVVHRGLSNTVVSGFADGSLDWIYIDGNHRYEFVKKDLDLYFPKVKSNGLIAGDDYANAGWWENGVTRAVDEFVKINPVKLITIQNNQFVLRKLRS
jgi:Methyltransferase domain